MWLDLKIVIEISDRLIKKVKDHYVNPYELDEICEAILDGTPLPKGHGRLIDETDLKTLYGLDDRLWWGNAVDKFTDLPTIIEADRGE